MKNHIIEISSLPLLLFCGQAAAKQQSTQPNVIYILADDLGYGDLSCYGQSKFQTPNIDKLAAEGVQFMQHYTACPVSAPARCGLMTGKHTGHTAIRGNMKEIGTDGKTYDTHLPASEFTLGELFKEKNYTTACVGKWGMGGIGTEGHPNKQGFDYFYGYLGQAHAHSYFPKFLHENSTEISLNKNEYSHDLIEEKAIKFIQNNKNKPFFLYLTFTIPHAELQIPKEYRIEYEDKFMPEKPHTTNYTPQEKPHATFAAMVSRLDLSVGRIEKLLKELMLDENTIVIFTSDNGPHQEGGADPKFFKSSGIYRGIKRDLYEGGIRIPMIAKWTNHFPAGTKSELPTAFWDMMPTFANLINAKTPKGLDGISFLPELSGKKQTQKHDFFYWEFHEQGGKQAVLQGDWKLIKLQVLNPQKTYFELYNIKTDPTEKENQLANFPEKVKQLSAIIDREHTENPIFKLCK